MTILDHFTLDYGNNGLTQAKSDLTAYDKQISELAAKGKKRTDEENKQLKELRKQRLEHTQDIKDQTRAADGLGDSFGGLATKIIGVGAALFGLSSLKTGVLNSVNRNTSLANQTKIAGQSFDDVRALSSAVQDEGGSAEGFESLVDAMTKTAHERGIAFTKVRELFDAANRDVQGKPLQEKGRILEQLYGVNDNAAIVLLEKETSEYQKIIDLKLRSTHLTDENIAKSKELTADIGNLSQAWDRFYSRLATLIVPTFTKTLNGLSNFTDDVSASMEISKTSKTHAEYEQRMAEYYKNKHSNNTPSATAIAPKTGNAAIDFWLSQGYTLNGAIGMAAQEKAESNGNPSARNIDKRGGVHYGLFQFDEARRSQILSATNIDVASASAEDQRKAAAWDARRRGDDVRINSGTSPEGSSAIANSYFEVSGETPFKRAQIAHDLAAQYTPTGPGAENSSGSGTSLNVKVDNVTINTNATDANAISREFANALSSHLNDLYSDTNDGIDR